MKLAESHLDDINLDSTFIYSEQSKSNILREAINVTDAESSFIIPEKILEEEQELRIEIAKFENLKFEETSKKNSLDSLINNYNSIIFNLNVKHEEIIKQIERDYPDYYNLKYKDDVISVKEVQTEILQKNQALLEYFVGDSSIFVFLINQEYFDVTVIPKDFPLNEMVNQFRSGLYTYFLSGDKDLNFYESSNDTFVKASLALYEKLVKPFKEKLPKKVIIIPDGVLGYLPFDALLMHEPTENHLFKSHDYLINDHQISYCYSATLLDEMKNKKYNASKNTLAFAPSFKKVKTTKTDILALRSGFDTLLFNVPEVKSIVSIMGGDVFIGEDATEEHFIQNAENYQILHLSTHGKANDQLGDYSYLAFTEIMDSLENERLYARELYNLKLNADLVVMSACETGIGELQKGEGLISLARGFSFAGAKSIITSLWSVSDKSTREIMETFYENIALGMEKDEALQKAKIEYIHQHQDLEANPYFWAGFVPIGDMSPIKSKSSIGNLKKYGLIALLLMGVFGFLYRRRFQN